MQEYVIPFDLSQVKEIKVPERRFERKDDLSRQTEGNVSAAEPVREAETGGNDKTLIQSLIEECHRAGGGTVVISRGNWYSGPLRLYSNICLELREGARIRFSREPEDYLPVVFTRWEGMECYNYSPLIYAENCENVGITGPGQLDGQGEYWWDWKKKQKAAAEELCYAQSRGIPVEKRYYGTREAALRPSFIQFVNCTGVQLTDFTITDGPQWTLHPVYCENVLIRGVTVHTRGHNTDGLNPDSCRNVWIDQCTFDTGDDCIAINSGMNEDGWRVNRPCERIAITRCRMNGGHGAIVIGSGMSGGVRNIYASDCIIDGTMQGIRIKSMRGRGGYVRDIEMKHITICHVTGAAIQISMFYPYTTVPPVSDKAPVFENIRICDISGCNNALGLEVRGLPDSPVRNLQLAAISLQAKEAMLVENTVGLSLEGVQLTEPADTGSKESEQTL